MADEPEEWASILGWHCWRGVAGIWYARRIGASPASALRAVSLDALRALIDQQNQSATLRGTSLWSGVSLRPW